jgi:hypothetical protein
MCLETVLCTFKDVVSVFKLARLAVFSPTTTWYHTSYILRLIRVLKPEHYDIVFGGLEQMVDMMVDFCLSPKEQLWMQSRDTLLDLVNPGNFERVTTAIVRRVDFMGEADQIRLLTVLTSCLRKWKNLPIVHLRFLVFELLEISKINSDDLVFLSAAFEFMAVFDLSFLDPKNMKSCLAKAVRVIAASLHLFSGEEWPEQLTPSSMQKIMPIVARVVNAVNIDIVAENSINYQTFLSPLHAALQVVLAFPPSRLDRSLIYLLIQKFQPIFPILVLKLLRKCWARLTSEQQTELLKSALGRIHCLARYYKRCRSPNWKYSE